MTTASSKSAGLKEAKQTNSKAKGGKMRQVSIQGFLVRQRGADSSIPKAQLLGLDLLPVAPAFFCKNT